MKARPLLLGLLVLGSALPGLSQGKPQAKEPLRPSEQVMCVVCGDYTFDSKDGTPATYEGEKIWLCSLRELELIKASPEKYVWASDPVSGSRVNKIHSRFTTDYRVQVRKKDGKVEVWPRRFFFESEKTRAEFLKNPARFLKEPYAV